MTCRSCGTEIAEKAIVCFRCGTATTEPVRKAVPVKPRRGPWPSILGAIVPLLAALYLFMTSDTSANPETTYTVAGVLAGVGGVLLIARLLRRR